MIQKNNPEPQARPPTLEGFQSAVASSLSLELSETGIQLPDPAVPVFNVAIDLATNCLWKGQVGCAVVLPPPEQRGG